MTDHQTLNDTKAVMGTSSMIFPTDSMTSSNETPFAFDHDGSGDRAGDEPFKRSRTLYEEAKELHNNRDYEAALHTFRETLAIQEPLLGKYHWDTIKTYWRMGRSHWSIADSSDRSSLAKQEQERAAVRCWKRSLRLAESLAGSDHKATKNLANDIATSLKSSKLSSASTMNLMEAIQKALEYERQGDALMRRTNYSKALKKYNSAMKLERKVFVSEISKANEDMDSTSTSKTSTSSTCSSVCTLDGADIACKMGSLYKIQGNIKSSLASYEMAQNTYHDTLGEDHPASLGATTNVRSLRDGGCDTPPRRRWFLGMFGGRQ